MQKYTIAKDEIIHPQLLTINESFIFVLHSAGCIPNWLFFQQFAEQILDSSWLNSLSKEIILWNDIGLQTNFLKPSKLL